MFIGRETELKVLERFYDSQRFEMLVVYGRRRVGKTKLLSEFTSNKNAIFFVAEENNDLLNKDKFTKAVLNHYKENYNVVFEQWEDLFKYIANKNDDERLVIVIDELPYLAYGNQSFLSILQNVIDHHLINKNIFLILCGSSISFMEDEIVLHKSPLYGRKTGQLKVAAMDYLDAKLFFESYSVEDQFRSFAVLGGIPHYLTQFDERLTFDENIVRKCMDSSSLFYDEPKNLMHQELRTPAVYNAIIEAIAGGASKLNEISTKIGEPANKVGKYLQSLLELEVVNKKTPIGQDSSRRSIYGINDPLFSFMFRHVYKYRSLVEQGHGEIIYFKSVKEDMQTFLGSRFENVCLEYLKRLNKNLMLEFLVEDFGRWWGSNPVTRQQEEIDIVGLSKLDGIYCECKYTNAKLGMSIYEKLVMRSHLVDRQNKFYYLFSKSGFTDELKKFAAMQNNLKLVGLEDIYSLSNEQSSQT